MDKRNPNRQIPSFTSVCGSRRLCAKNKMLYTRPKPDVLQGILQSKANPDYKTRRLWYELNMPECASRLFDGQTLSDLPESIICPKERRTTTAPRPEGSKAKASSNYMSMRMEREHFRRKLVELIINMDTEDAPKQETTSDTGFPDQSERETLRYYYYIKHGIDTIHVSTISKKTLKM